MCVWTSKTVGKICELPYNVFRKMCRGLFYNGKRYCTQRLFFRTEIGSSDEGGSAGRQESAGRGNFMLKSFEFGNPRAQHVLIQLVDDHDLAGMEKEITAIRAATDVDFRSWPCRSQTGTGICRPGRRRRSLAKCPLVTAPKKRCRKC